MSSGQRTRCLSGGAATARVAAILTLLRPSGKLIVREAQGQTLRVIVDGLGEIPWEGRLSVGWHTALLQEDRTVFYELFEGLRSADRVPDAGVGIEYRITGKRFRCSCLRYR
ncbi:MAG: hypothetical protein AAGA56_10280 [Myxococcota bacterium]